MYIETSVAAARYVTCTRLWVLTHGLCRPTVHMARIGETSESPPSHLMISKQSTCNGMLIGQPVSLFSVGSQPIQQATWADRLCTAMRSLSASHQVLTKRIDSSSSQNERGCSCSTLAMSVIA